MLLPSPEDIIRIHEIVLRKIGGSDGLRDAGALEAASAQPAASFGGQEMYPNLFLKATAVFESLAQNHPFIDGNKRTAFMTAVYIVEQNGYQTSFDQKDIEDTVLKFVTTKPSLEDIALWLESNSRKS